tara:strand:+ start:3578 stop:4789 length:1212 start_codon:yes stop_codon:yes gene_type:complete
MKKTAMTLALASTCAMSTQAGTVITDGPDIILKTKGGLEARTSDGRYSFKVGGRIQLDYNDYDGVINKAVDSDGSDIWFRRARLELSGHYDDWSYLMSYNLTEDGSIDQLNFGYGGWGDLANLTFGQQKEDFGLEDTGSSKWTTAIERSLPANAFDTGNNVGIKLSGSNNLLTYSLGVFKQDVDGQNDLDTATTGRFVIRPLNNESGLLHLGVGYTQRDSDNGFDSIESRLGVRGGENKTATKVSAGYLGGLADEMTAMNIELAASFGPVHVMAEYFDGELSGVGATPDLEADGYYAQVGWIVTGERRSYKNVIAAFDKIKPAGSGGAWEVFARYDELDFSDNEGEPLIKLAGTTGNTLTVGANWYVNEVVKASLNYVKADVDEAIKGEDDGSAIVARLQFAF